MKFKPRYTIYQVLNPFRNLRLSIMPIISQSYKELISTLTDLTDLSVNLRYTKTDIHSNRNTPIQHIILYTMKDLSK